MLLWHPKLLWQRWHWQQRQRSLPIRRRLALPLHRPLLREPLKSILLRFPRLVSPPRRLERTGRRAGEAFGGKVPLAAAAAAH
jgi:hypothetical protein